MASHARPRSLLYNIVNEKSKRTSRYSPPRSWLLSCPSTSTMLSLVCVGCGYLLFSSRCPGPLVNPAWEFQTEDWNWNGEDFTFTIKNVERQNSVFYRILWNFHGIGYVRESKESAWVMALCTNGWNGKTFDDATRWGNIVTRHIIFFCHFLWQCWECENGFCG